VSAAAIDYGALAERFVAAQLAGDRREALRLVIDEGIGRGARVIDVQARVIRAAQDRLGQLWQANRISIAQEHLATGISQMVMTLLFEHIAPTPRNDIVVSVACVEGELHEFPARLVADYLEQAGFTVRHYGANVPVDELVPLLGYDTPQLLALSVTMNLHVGALRASVARVRAAFPQLPVMIGGRAVAWAEHLAADLGVHAPPATPEELVEAVRRLTGGSA